MAISQVNNTTSNPLAASSSSGTSSAAEQQDRFMKLLVAQMKNQDPLNPMDNAQMTSQIAQINTVSGIEKLNTTVTSLLASFNNLQAQSATQLPGRSVLVPGSGLTLADGQAMGGVELGGAADAVTVDIVDAAGTTVRSLALGASDAGVRSFTWDGLQTDGKAAAAGNYRLRVSGHRWRQRGGRHPIGRQPRAGGEQRQQWRAARSGQCRHACLQRHASSFL